jgi:hypothetical protein
VEQFVGKIRYKEFCYGFAAFICKTVNLFLDAVRRQVKQNNCGLTSTVSTI